MWIGLIYAEGRKTAAKVDVRSRCSSRFKVGFEVLTEVIMKGSIFCDITPYNPEKSPDVLGNISPR
jgi:hypothetical protein